jgi:hypothetical protein
MNKYIINPRETIIKLNYYKYDIAKKILSDLYKKTFTSTPIPLKQELSFWSSFVNKNYSIVIDDIYTQDDISILRKEIELVAGLELDKCTKYYIIRKNMC